MSGYVSYRITFDALVFVISSFCSTIVSVLNLNNHYSIVLWIREIMNV